MRILVDDGMEDEGTEVKRDAEELRKAMEGESSYFRKTKLYDDPDSGVLAQHESRASQHQVGGRHGGQRRV